ncbi:MAG: hypothetical protein K2P79_03015 [Sphingomonas sp.]|nr:hypothetical protein [Sphingomonas sp.]
MRVFVMLSFGALVACSAEDKGGNAAAVVTNAALPAAAALRGDEPATSPSAVAARDTVARYFAMIDGKDYAGAYRLWGNDGADAGGTIDDFKKTFAIYSKYEPIIGEPTEIHARDGVQYVLVQAKLHVENRKTGKIADRSGTVMLRRSANPDDPVEAKRDWKIWGVDLRVGG